MYSNTGTLFLTNTILFNTNQYVQTGILSYSVVTYVTACTDLWVYEKCIHMCMHAHMRTHT